MINSVGEFLEVSLKKILSAAEIRKQCNVEFDQSIVKFSRTEKNRSNSIPQNVAPFNLLGNV